MASTRSGAQQTVVARFHLHRRRTLGATVHAAGGANAAGESVRALRAAATLGERLRRAAAGAGKGSHRVWQAARTFPAPGRPDAGGRTIPMLAARPGRAA